MVSSGILYFTSNVFRATFTQAVQVEDVEPIVLWDLVDFLVLVICVEHIMLLFKIFMEYLIPLTPEFVKEGEYNREIIAGKLNKKIQLHKLEAAGNPLLIPGAKHDDAAKLTTHRSLHD